MHNSFNLEHYICYTTLLNTFRAARCSSSGGPIVSPQPLVSSPSVSSRTVCRWRVDSALHPHTVRLLTEGDDTRGCGYTIGPPDDEQRAARNVLRSVVWHMYCWRLKQLCTKLVFWKVYTMMHGQKKIKSYKCLSSERINPTFPVL